MSKIGRNRKGRGFGAKKTNWKPAVATHEVRFQIIRKKNGLTEHIKYKPVVLPKEGVPQPKAGPNRAQKRKDAKWERGQLMRDKKIKIAEAHDIGKAQKAKRIEKRHEENRKRSAARKAAKKNETSK